MESSVRLALARSGVFSADFVNKHGDMVAEALLKGGLSDRSIANLGQNTPTNADGLTIKTPLSMCGQCGLSLSDRADKAVAASVLFLSGWQSVSHMPRRCRTKTCDAHDKYVWYNYISRDEHCREWQWPSDRRLEFFFIAPSWGVSMEWLQQMTQRLASQFASFTGEASVHEEAAHRAGKLKLVPDKAKQKIKEAWMMWRLVVRIHERWSKDAAVDRLPINLYMAFEDLATRSLSWYLPLMLKRRLDHMHAANVPNDTVIVDGNCKLSRRICGRDAAELKVHSGLKDQLVVRCGEPPAVKRRRCREHDAGVDAEALDRWGEERVESHRKCTGQRAATLRHPYEVRLVDRRFAGDAKYPRRWCLADQVPTAVLSEYWASLDAPVQDGDNTKRSGRRLVSKSSQHDLLSTKCKTHKESRHGRASQSAGWLFASSSNGFLIHLQEFHGAESLGQRYHFVGDIFEVMPSLKLVVHDDACHLRKYVDKRAAASELASRMVYPHVKYVVDRFHSKGHVDKWCVDNCLHTTEENATVMKGVNSSVCEQQFSSLGRFKFMVSKMGRATAAVFLNEMVEARNRKQFRVPF
jgi:hypothetical protein